MATLAQQNYLAKLYIGYFGRLMEKGGLEYWTKEIDSRGMDAVANGIYFGATGTDAAIRDLSNRDYVAQVYRNVLNREGDEGGINYWSGELAKGVGRDIIVMRIIDNATGSDVARLENMGQVALYFAQNYDPNKSASPLETKNAVTADPASVESAKKLVDGKTTPTPEPENPKQINLDDSTKLYDEKGSTKDDVYNVEAFKDGSKIYGDAGSDTVDFSLYEKTTAAVDANLRTGVVNIDGKKLNVSWVENVVGTKNNDKLVGDHNDNILKMGGGADTVDAGVGNDLIVAASATNATDSTIDGAANYDTLRVLDSALTLDSGTPPEWRNVEVLEIGYATGDQSKSKAATLTLENGDELSTLGLLEVKANATPELDRKGVELSDKIISKAADMDLSTIKLAGFEELVIEGGSGELTIKGETLKQVKTVTGNDTTLALIDKDGAEFDLSKPKFTGITQIVAPVDTNGNEIEAIIIANQSLLGSSAFAGNFSNVTLKLTGRSIDLSDAAVDFTNMAAPFKEVQYNGVIDLTVKAADVTAGGALDGVSFVGSAEVDYQMFLIKDDGTSSDVDLRGVTLENIEQLLFDNVKEVILNDDTIMDVNNIAGDRSTGTYLLNGNEPDDKGKAVPLDLTGVKLRDVAGLGAATEPTDTAGNNIAQQFLIDVAMANESFVNAPVPVSAVWGTLILAEAGTYNLTAIKYGKVVVEGSAGNDVVHGSNLPMTFNMGAGDDTVIAGDEADFLYGNSGNDTLKGGKGDDSLDGGEGNDTLEAGDGVDDITGGKGQDTITGGKGQDTFFFKSGDTGVTESTVDIITDFKIGEDTLDFTFVTNSTAVTEIDNNAEDPFIANYAAEFASAASLSAAAAAALNKLYEVNKVAIESNATANDASSQLVAQFTYGDKSYVAVDAYAYNVADDYKSVTVDFLVKLQGVTGTLTLDELNISAEEPAAV